MRFIAKLGGIIIKADLGIRGESETFVTDTKVIVNVILHGNSQRDD